MWEMLAPLVRGPVRIPHGPGGFGRGFGHFGSFIVHAAIWHVVGRIVGSVFRHTPALGTLVVVLLLSAGIVAGLRWVRNRRRQRSRDYGREYSRAGRGPRDW